jgi:hypothetical protein
VQRGIERPAGLHGEKDRAHRADRDDREGRSRCD